MTFWSHEYTKAMRSCIQEVILKLHRIPSTNMLSWCFDLPSYSFHPSTGKRLVASIYQQCHLQAQLGKTRWLLVPRENRPHQMHFQSFQQKSFDQSWYPGQSQDSQLHIAMDLDSVVSLFTCIWHLHIFSFLQSADYTSSPSNSFTCLVPKLQLVC